MQIIYSIYSNYFLVYVISLGKIKYTYSKSTFKYISEKNMKYIFKKYTRRQLKLYFL